MTFLSFAVAITLGGTYFVLEAHQAPAQDKEITGQLEDKLRQKLTTKFYENTQWSYPETLQVDGKDYQVKYTIDHKLTEFLKKMMKLYRPDFCSIVVIDNNNGDILSAVGYNGRNKKFNLQIPFSSTHPSASLIKIITSADLIENAGLDEYAEFSFRGRGTTLYRYQLIDKMTRWTRSQKLINAFAYSNNVIFGKAAIQKSNAINIFKVASDMGFNRDIMRDLYIGRSQFTMPVDQYNLAELASGFNRKTLMSPVHAAVLSQIIANDGIMINPGIVNYVYDEEGKRYFNDHDEKQRVLAAETAETLRKFMERTIDRGTARSVSRKMKRKAKSYFDIGGKTGSITGGIPYGKRDWLTAYAIPRDFNDKGVSIAIMNINLKRWRVKSTTLARKVFEYFYDVYQDKNLDQLNASL